MPVAALSDEESGVTGGGKTADETQLISPIVRNVAGSTASGSSSRVPGKLNSVHSESSVGVPSVGGTSEGGGSFETIFSEDSRAADSKATAANTIGTSYLSRRFGAVTNWVEDYKTRKSGYGPPYHEEYGGDLPGDCNRIIADLQEIDELLRNGANPNVGHPQDHGLTPVHFAARFGNTELLKILRRAGGNPDITSSLGLTPLAYACAFKLSIDKGGGGALEDKQNAVVKWLLDQGADPNHVDKAGYTPLVWACRSGVFSAVVMLVEAGADVMQRRPTLPGGGQVRLPKADALAVTWDKKIERYLQAKIGIILQREEALSRRDVRRESRNVRLKAMHDAIAERKEARLFVIQAKQQARQTEELSMELMKIDEAEEARKARRDWLRLMKLSPGIWAKEEVSADQKTHAKEGRRSSPTSTHSRGGGPRPRWVFDTTLGVSKKEAAAHDVLEEAQQVEAFILRGDRKEKIVAPRWRSITGKRLLRLDHGQRLGGEAKGGSAHRRRQRQGGAGGGEEAVRVGESAGPLSGLEEERSESSSSSSCSTTTSSSSRNATTVPAL